MAKNGETVDTVRDFIFGGSKITADGDCSPEVKRHLLLGRKPMTNLDSILQSRDITLLGSGPAYREQDLLLYLTQPSPLVPLGTRESEAGETSSAEAQGKDRQTHGL